MKKLGSYYTNECNQRYNIIPVFINLVFFTKILNLKIGIYFSTLENKLTVCYNIVVFYYFIVCGRVLCRMF